MDLPQDVRLEIELFQQRDPGVQITVKSEPAPAQKKKEEQALKFFFGGGLVVIPAGLAHLVQDARDFFGKGTRGHGLGNTGFFLLPPFKRQTRPEQGLFEIVRVFGLALPTDFFPLRGLADEFINGHVQIIDSIFQ